LNASTLPWSAGGPSRQCTIRHSIRATGVGLHSGEPVLMRLRPGPVDSGVVFNRIDLAPAVSIPARLDHVVDTQRATTLGSGSARVATVEHLLAALAGLRIDNLQVDVSAAELPIMDGSAAPFVFLLQAAGIEEQAAPKRYLRILDDVCHEAGDVRARLRPHDGCRFEYTLQYDHPFFAGRALRCAVELSPTSFVKEVCRARTFGFLSEITYLKAQNLARGGSLDNAVVVDDRGVMNPGGLRCEDEFAKHKVLDAIGDVHLLGHPLIGAFSGHKSGHASNKALLARLMATPRAWKIVTADEVAANASLARFGARLGTG
jgi:UDP-3-O-[3-hydroxymyristoyl] N-acetylglucosamine deacetylase